MPQIEKRGGRNAAAHCDRRSDKELRQNCRCPKGLDANDRYMDFFGDSLNFEAETVEHREIVGIAAACCREVVAENYAARSAAHAEIL